MSSEQIRLIFARNLNKLIEERHESQVEVANKLGIKQSTFSSWCTGAKFPRADKLDMLAVYFGVEREELIKENAAPRLNLNPDAAHKLEGLIQIVNDMTEDEWDKLMDYASLILSAKQAHKED